MWKPLLEGPIFPKLFIGEGKEESQIYNLEKITLSESRSPAFRLTTICSQPAVNTDFRYDLTRNVVYQFEENLSYNANFPISEENSPVTLKCLEGKIIQTFQDQRSPEQFAHQVAQYKLALSQRRLETLGDPREIEAEYKNRIQFLAGRAAFRPSSIMTQDRNEAEAKLQQLRKAQQALRNAQQKLDRFSDDETDSQPQFEDDEI